MKLYEIEKAIDDIITQGLSIDEETGEVMFDEKDLESLEMAKEEKIENLCLYIKNLNGEAEMVKAEADKLSKRAKTCLNKAERLENFVKEFLQGETFKTDKVVVSYRKSEVLEVNDMSNIPQEYLIAQEPKVDKMGLKKAVKGGLEIGGVALVEKNNMTIK